MALIKYANSLMKNNNIGYVREYLWTGNNNKYHGGSIKYDLDWVADNWNSHGCDLWEEIQYVEMIVILWN
jgi:hypothetical protein